MGEQLNKPGAAWGSSFSHSALRGTTLKLRHLATSVAATTALALVGAAPAFAQETTINIRDSHVPTTAEGFKNVKCEGPFENLDGDVDGWHFVLPGNDASFVSLTLTYDTPDGDVVATIASTDSSAPSVGPGWSGYIDAAGASGAFRHAYVFTDADWTLTAGSAVSEGGHDVFNLSHTCPGGPVEPTPTPTPTPGEEGEEGDEANGEEPGDEAGAEEEGDVDAEEPAPVPTEVPAGVNGTPGSMGGLIGLLALVGAFAVGGMALIKRRFLQTS
jgi:hypothetical protein